jgi:hypothetical protein
MNITIIYQANWKQRNIFFLVYFLLLVDLLHRGNGCWRWAVIIEFCKNVGESCLHNFMIMCQRLALGPWDYTELSSPTVKWRGCVTHCRWRASFRLFSLLLSRASRYPMDHLFACSLPAGCSPDGVGYFSIDLTRIKLGADEDNKVATQTDSCYGNA